MNSINPMMSARMVSPAAPPSVMSRRGSLGRVVGRLECLVVLAGWMMAAAAWGDGDQPTSAAPVANNYSDRPAEADAEQGRSKAKVGRRIFSDLRLSRPVGIGCISCHDPRTAFADPRVVSPGAVPGRVGTRNAPTLMYAALIPSFAYEDLLTEEGEEIYVWEGGLFHDGRAQDQFEQVQQPFFHADEMNLPNPAALADRLRKANYADEFRKTVGAAAWADDEQLNYHAYRALVEFLKEPLFRPFDARIDDYLKGKKEALNESEKRGLEVFKNAGKCADCHLLAARSWSQPLLSDFGYDNLGAPSRGKKDPGLGGHTGNAEELGQFRAPTLRNIELTAPYLHNGSIASLREVVEFYNKRDLEPKRWGATDYPATVNHDDLGDLGLSDQQVDDLVALMSAFTDRSLLSEEVRAGRVFPEAPPGVPSTLEMQLHFPDWTHRLHPAFPRSSEPPSEGGAFGKKESGVGEMATSLGKGRPTFSIPWK